MEIVHEVTDPLPRCPICFMHMHTVRLIKQQRTDMYNRVTEMWLRRRDVEIAQREG